MRAKNYAGPFAHVPEYNACADCHDAHQLGIDTASCKTCHGVDDPGTIRMKSVGDYDGDGNVTEGLKKKSSGVQEVLYKAFRLMLLMLPAHPLSTHRTAIRTSSLIPMLMVPLDRRRGNPP